MTRTAGDLVAQEGESDNRPNMRAHQDAPSQRQVRTLIAEA